MSTNKRNKGSMLKAAKDMDYLIRMFGDDKEKLQPLIIAHLIVMGWGREKATAYATLVVEFAKLNDSGLNIWSG